ncbi:MAG: ABC transporter permease, partial [Eisenbergiella sp.]
FAASMLGLALTFFTSAVQVFFKDMAQIVGICLQFGMWLTPIMYDEKIFTDRAPWLGTVFKLNPFYYIAAGYRDSMMTGNWFFERPTMTLYFWAVTLILMLIGLKMFKKLRPHFSDVL